MSHVEHIKIRDIFYYVSESLQKSGIFLGVIFNITDGFSFRKVLFSQMWKLLGKRATPSKYRRFFVKSLETAEVFWKSPEITGIFWKPQVLPGVLSKLPILPEVLSKPLVIPRVTQKPLVLLGVLSKPSVLPYSHGVLSANFHFTVYKARLQVFVLKVWLSYFLHQLQISWFLLCTFLLSW